MVLVARVVDETGRSPDDRDAFSRHLDEVMEELIRLEVLDPFVGGDLAQGHVEISLGVTASSDLEAAQKAFTCIRSAVHAAGGATPDWEARWRFERIERAQQLIDV